MDAPKKHRKQAEPPLGKDSYILKTHGGLGDVLWLAAKLTRLDRPLHILISSENRHRPRRSGYMVDHLPMVNSWSYDDSSFCPATGQDWPPPGDPCTAIGQTWAELHVPPGAPFRLECNRWLEGGRRLEDWLPDLPTVHHFDFEPCAPPSLLFKRPNVLLHLAGWPDVPDTVWRTAVDLFRPVAHVYLVGGSYDHRPRTVYELSRRQGGVTLLEDIAWPDLMGCLQNTDYCFGHASGFTALADVLRVRGAVFNPHCVPKLIGTWNSPENPGLVHVDRVDAFQAAMKAALDQLAGTSSATWPPTLPRGDRLAAFNDGDDVLRAVRAAARQLRAQTTAVIALRPPPPYLAAAVLSGAYAAGKVVQSLYMVGCNADTFLAALHEGNRSSRKPSLSADPGPWPGPRKDEAFDLIVVWASDDPAQTAGVVRAAWKQVSRQGAVLVGPGPAAQAAAESLGATLNTTPAEVQNAAGWFYIHRRL